MLRVVWLLLGLHHRTSVVLGWAVVCVRIGGLLLRMVLCVRVHLERMSAVDGATG